MADTEEPQPDPVEGEGKKTGKNGGKKSSFPKRYIVAIMIFLGICVQYALRVNLSVAIGAMCNNHTIEQNGFTIQKVCFSLLNLWCSAVQTERKDVGEEEGRKRNTFV